MVGDPHREITADILYDHIQSPEEAQHEKTYYDKKAGNGKNVSEKAQIIACTYTAAAAVTYGEHGKVAEAGRQILIRVLKLE